MAKLTPRIKSEIFRQLNERGLPWKDARFVLQNGDFVRLGSGGFSEVYVMEDAAGSGKEYAVKIIGLKEDHRILKSGIPAYINEPQMQKELSEQCESVVKIYDQVVLSVRPDENGKIDEVRMGEDSAEQTGWLTMILIRMEKLTPVIEQSITMDYSFQIPALARSDEKEILKLATDVAEALKISHERKIIHRDVKLENIFYDSETGHYKLGDFGIARVTDQGSATTRIGTNGYQAPEAEIGAAEKYSFEADIYSFGVTLYLLLNELRFPGSKHPYYPERSVQYNPNAVIERPKHGSERLKEFVSVMLCYDPKDRLPSTMAEVFDTCRYLLVNIDGENETIETTKKQEKPYQLEFLSAPKQGELSLPEHIKEWEETKKNLPPELRDVSPEEWHLHTVHYQAGQGTPAAEKKEEAPVPAPAPVLKPIATEDALVAPPSDQEISPHPQDKGENFPMDAIFRDRGEIRIPGAAGASGPKAVPAANKPAGSWEENTPASGDEAVSGKKEPTEIERNEAENEALEAKRRLREAERRKKDSKVRLFSGLALFAGLTYFCALGKPDTTAFTRIPALISLAVNIATSFLLTLERRRSLRGKHKERILSIYILPFLFSIVVLFLCGYRWLLLFVCFSLLSGCVTVVLAVSLTQITYLTLIAPGVLTIPEGLLTSKFVFWFFALVFFGFLITVWREQRSYSGIYYLIFEEESIYILLGVLLCLAGLFLWVMNRIPIFTIPPLLMEMHFLYLGVLSLLYGVFLAR